VTLVLALVSPALGDQSLSSLATQPLLAASPFAQTQVISPGGVGVGGALAVSADGSTAVIGDNPGGVLIPGGVWFFTRVNGSWEQQGPELPVGKVLSVAVSADGSTAVIGEIPGGTCCGAELSVYVRSGSTWSEQGQPLTAPAQGDPNDVNFGDSVALSADGNTVLSGDRVFTRIGSTWTPAAELDPSGVEPESGFGESVAISGDGDTALIGAPQQKHAGPDGESYRGGVWYFARVGTQWVQEGKVLEFEGKLPYGLAGSTLFGYSLALDEDGRTAVIGAPRYGGTMNEPPDEKGIVFIYARPKTEWSRRTRLMSSDMHVLEEFGLSVALSADGDTALVGIEPGDGTSSTQHKDFVGGAFAFTRTGSSWGQEQKLAADAEGVASSQAPGVSLSANGSVALVGDPAHSVLSFSAEPLS
jgi:hypothetical protein